LLLLHAMVLMLGGHYTYAQVPFFDWIKPLLGWHRNNYDKLGHFFQGFVPGVIAQELLTRVLNIRKTTWVAVIAILSCLGISALYEILEWWIAIASGTQADAFLGTQGYIWDTQSDMLMALIGAVFSVVLMRILRVKIAP
jgi:putative membrane protein